jgi:endonuclease/exonuclease/phosphatase family metal-dependent hydrolase
MKDISIVSWNVQGNFNFTGHTAFKKIYPHLLDLAADIFALQEMRGAEKKLAAATGLKQYQVFIPRTNIGSSLKVLGLNQNILLSRFQILQSADLKFPAFTTRRPLENYTRTDLQIGDRILRIYNCHFAIDKVGIRTRLMQLDHVLMDARSHLGPTIICGDLNATIPPPGLNRAIISHWHREPREEILLSGQPENRDEREIFNQTILTAGFKEVLDLYIPTWSVWKTKLWEIFKLKLDWFLVKDIEVISAKLGPYISDHRPIIVRVRI